MALPICGQGPGAWGIWHIANPAGEKKGVEPSTASEHEGVGLWSPLHLLPTAVVAPGIIPLSSSEITEGETEALSQIGVV